MNLGQSLFQDTYFVAGAQLTPYRQLRQIELELRSIEDALVRSSLAARRLRLKISKLDPAIPEDALDIEEAEWDLAQQVQLQRDAEARRQNFMHLKSTLLKNTPNEYWDAGYEAAEEQHWLMHFSKQLALENLTPGTASKHTIEQVMLLPQNLQQQIAASAKEQFLLLSGSAAKT